MSYSITYSSETGNTKKLADKVKESLPVCPVYFGAPNDIAKSADTIFVGFWTNEGTCDDLTKDFLKGLNGKNIFLFGSAGYAKQEYLKQIIDNTKENINSSNKVVGCFMCQGKMRQRVLEKYEEQKKLSDKPEVFDGLIANFNEALKHPNDDDLDRLELCVNKALKED